jgi:hypothetical protein
MTDIDRAIEEVKAELMPANLRFDESWERLPGETGAAYAAFCAFRDLGFERNIRKAVEAHFHKQKCDTEKDKGKQEKRYRVWRNWCSQFRWRERATDYDRYTERLKQTEMRKTIEAQGGKAPGHYRENACRCGKKT